MLIDFFFEIIDFIYLWLDVFYRDWITVFSIVIQPTIIDRRGWTDYTIVLRWLRISFIAVRFVVRRSVRIVLRVALCELFWHNFAPHIILTFTVFSNCKAILAKFEVLPQPERLLEYIVQTEISSISIFVVRLFDTIFPISTVFPVGTIVLILVLVTLLFVFLLVLLLFVLAFFALALFVLALFILFLLILILALLLRLGFRF